MQQNQIYTQKALVRVAIEDIRKLQSLQTKSKNQKSKIFLPNRKFQLVIQKDQEFEVLMNKVWRAQLHHWNLRRRNQTSMKIHEHSNMILYSINFRNQKWGKRSQISWSQIKVKRNLMFSYKWLKNRKFQNQNRRFKHLINS